MDQTGNVPERWRGLVQLAAYRLHFTKAIDRTTVERRADELLQPHLYADTPPEFYAAISHALQTGERLAPDGEDEHYLRQFLADLREALDARRPWPERPYTELSLSEWEKYRHLDPIAGLKPSAMDTGSRLHVVFEHVPGSGYVVVLRLRSGQVVALQGPQGYGEMGVLVRADTDDPQATLAEFQKLTGIQSDEIIVRPY